MYEITRQRFNDALRAYKLVIGGMPEEFQKEFSIFEDFLNGDGFSYFHSRDIVKVDERAMRKIDMLNGPHAAAMLRAWIIKYRVG